MRTVCIVALIAYAALFLPATPSHAASDIVLVLDASGSMWGQIEGENKIVIARRVLAELLAELPDDAEVGLVAYGHRREGDCADVETLAELQPLDRSALVEVIGGLNPKGKTPITAAVQHALGLLEGRAEAASIILLSDGLETCGGDVCEAVRLAKSRADELVFHVVGFDVGGEDVSSLECAAQAGGGLFLAAENADQLAAALDAAVSLAPGAPAGSLSIGATADGELQDVSIVATPRGGGEPIVSRTYRSSETNPRLLPLPAGIYDIEVRALGLRGDTKRSFAGLEIRDGTVVERAVDFSTGEIAIAVRRNGALSDAVYRVFVAESGERVAQGRTYTSSSSNPATVRITSGHYRVEIGGLEIGGAPERDLGVIEVEPRGRVELAHDFETGDLIVGVRRGEALVDATISVRDGEGKEVARSRTYTTPEKNPARFVLEPGTYRVRVREIRGAERELTVEVGVQTSVERVLDLDSR